MMKLITPKEIEQWNPSGFDEILGCEHARKAVSNAVNVDSDIPNIFIAGEPGTGKTTLVNIASKAALCQSKSNRPCSRCEKCKGVDTRFSECGLFVAFDEVVRNYHVIDCCNTSTEELTDVILQLRDIGNQIVVLDEAQGLRRRDLDFKFLEPMEKYPNTTWIASTAYPHLLNPMFVRRFSVRVETQKPSVEECERFVIERCETWSIDIEEGASNLLSYKSSQNISEVIRVLAMSASTIDRRLSFELVKSFSFLDLSGEELR